MENFAEFMIDFILEYFKEIIAVFMAIISFFSLIVSCVRRVKFFRLKDFFSNAPLFVAVAESIFGAGNGELKSECVKNWLFDLSKKLDLSLSDKEITAFIEAVLLAPQKKILEVNNEKVESSKCEE